MPQKHEQETSVDNTKHPPRILKKKTAVQEKDDTYSSTTVAKKKVVVVTKKKIFIKKHGANKSTEDATTTSATSNVASEQNNRTSTSDNRIGANTSGDTRRRYDGSGSSQGGGNNNRQNNRNNSSTTHKPFENKAKIGDASSVSAASAKPSTKKEVGKKKDFQNRTYAKDSKQFGAQREEERIFNKLQAKKKQQEARLSNVSKEIDIMETITVGNLAKKMNLRAADLISKLMTMGSMVRVNDLIDSETAIILADEFGCKVNVISLEEETQVEVVKDDEKDLSPRAPVVTIMGHVDHGKTSLLDVIRKTNVVAKESGGITQNIGAYKVKSKLGDIAFIDTPGHAAFTKMRSRGAKCTDIVILVVAADDGVMPQTVEAIRHAQDAEVPIIVAVNKIDLPNKDIDKVKAQLAEYKLSPEEWGGETQYVYVSAVTKEGIDNLLEAISLQAEILELRANKERDAIGVVLESSLDQGRGAVATVLVQNGTLRIGDYFVCGLAVGKVRAMIDDKGHRIDEAGPSTPVEILGFENTPEAGEDFHVLRDEHQAKGIAEKRKQLKQQEAVKATVRVTLDNLYDHIADAAMQEFNVIIKADVQGSAEALKESLGKIESDKIRFVCIHAASGMVNESDVDLAHVSNAIIIAYRVRPSAKAKELSEKLSVSIEKYDVIYEAIHSIQNAMKGALAREKKEVDMGTAEIREVFRIPKIGVIAGCYITSGKVERNTNVRIIRDGVVIYTSKIGSIRRLKEDVKEAQQGYECGIGIDNFSDIREGDILEVYKIEEVAQEL